MNIQPTSFTKNHLINNNGPNMHLMPADEITLKRRQEDLSRRPSYRRIFNEITGQSGPLDPPIVVSQLPPRLAPARHSPQSVSISSNQAPNGSPSPQAIDLLNSVAAGMQDSVASSQSPVSVVDLQTTAQATQLQQLQQHSSQHHQQQQQQAPSQQQHQQQQQQHHQQQHHHLSTSHLQQHPQQQLQHHQQQAPQQQHQQHHHLPANHLQQHPQQHPRHHHHPHPHPPQQQHQPQQPPQPPQQQQQQQHLIHQIQTTPSPTITSGGVINEEVTKKRELRLQKNREAAKECRRKKKEYIKCLENRVAVLENQNKALIDELKTLKDLYCKSTTE